MLHIGSRPTVRLRIKTRGNPNQMILDRQQISLYVAQDNSDSVAVVDTRSNKVAADIGPREPNMMSPKLSFVIAEAHQTVWRSLLMVQLCTSRTVELILLR